MKPFVHLVVALAAAMVSMTPASTQTEPYCYTCPAGSDITRAEDGRFYCTTDAGATVGVPLWAVPYTAAVAWAVPSPGVGCPGGYERVVVDDVEWCAACPVGYERRGGYCLQCIDGYRLIGTVRASAQQACTTLGPWDWRQLGDRRGPVEHVQDGLLLIGDAWTNGHLREGFRDGNGIESTRTFDVSGGGQIRVRFAVNGQGRYLAATTWLASGMATHHLTTHNTWAGSALVTDGVWLYAQATIQADGSYRVTVSDAGYDGVPIAVTEGRLTDTAIRLRFEFSDNYAGPTAAAIVSEATVCTNR